MSSGRPHNRENERACGDEKNLVWPRGKRADRASPRRCCWRLSCWCFRAVPRSSRRGRGKKEEHPPRCKRRPRRSSPCRMGRAQRGSLPRMGRMGRAYRSSPCRMGRPSGSNPPAQPKEQDPKEQDPKEQGEPALQQDPPKEPEPTAPSQQTEPAQPPQTAPDQPVQPVQSCTLVVECSTVLGHMDELDPDKQELIPSDGVLLQTEVVIEEGDTAYDVLERAAREANMHLESSVTPGYGSVYIEGIANLYEFDCGSLSGWIYFVNGESFSHSASQQTVQAGDEVAFRYTCDLGEDLK